MRLNRHPHWSGLLWGQWNKGMQKYGMTVDDNPGDSSYWADHAAQEAADGAVYALRVSDTGHPVRGRLAAFLFALAARVLLPVR